MVRACIVLSLSLVAAPLVALAAGRIEAKADAGAACAAKPIAAARRSAQARRAAGDPAGAWRVLAPFVDLHCLPDEAKAPPAAEHSTLSDYAWLLNDAYVNGADKRFGRAALESEACVELLSPLTNEDLVPGPWMSPALRQATVANIKACTKSCGPSLGCVNFRANAFSTHMSLAKTFRKRDCHGGAGQALDDGRCIELSGKAGVGFVWRDHIKTDLPTEADERTYCPALYVYSRDRERAVRLEFPENSGLRSGSFCCTPVHLRVKPGTNEFIISSDEIAAECNGGTARTLIEEIYRLPPGATAPILVRDNSMGLH